MLSSVVYRINQPLFSLFSFFLRKLASSLSFVFNGMRLASFTLFTLNSVSPLYAPFTQAPVGYAPTPHQHLNLYLNFKRYLARAWGCPVRRQTVNGKRPIARPATRHSPLATSAGASLA